MRIAIRAETSRDFRPLIGDVSVGLSTGTSGQRGLFLATPRERRLWAAIMLGRYWPELWRRQRIAFFMRADNALYRGLSNPLVRFAFFDLLAPLDAQMPRLAELAPSVLIAPARVLAMLAERQAAGQIRLAPRRVISVAETLSPEDAALIEAAFGIRVDQVYQATEGVLAMTCHAGSLHLNERWLRIDREVIDPATGAFCPIIHDFTRESLPILNYRLNDVLIPDPRPCPCGCASQRLARIEGREDDMLWWPRPRDRAWFPPRRSAPPSPACRKACETIASSSAAGCCTCGWTAPRRGPRRRCAPAWPHWPGRWGPSCPSLPFTPACRRRPTPSAAAFGSNRRRSRPPRIREATPAKASCAEPRHGGFGIAPSHGIALDPGPTLGGSSQ